VLLLGLRFILIVNQTIAGVLVLDFHGDASPAVVLQVVIKGHVEGAIIFVNMAKFV
jgi:hypothetical protein